MNLDKLVSIIIPTYNRAHLIGETLDSILAQTYTNWECIIVDDGSTDDTENIIQGYIAKDTRFQYHKRPADRLKGANACRNYGFTLSKGEYILFLDSDDLLKNNCLINRLKTFSSNNKIDFVVANTSYYKNGKFGLKSMCDFPKDTSTSVYLHHFLTYQLPWAIMSILWKRKIVLEINFDEKLNRFQDVDFHIRVLHNKNYNCLRNNEIDNYYRIDVDKKLSSKFIGNMLGAFIFFFNKYDSLLKKDSYRSDFRKFNATIFTQFVVPYFRENKEIGNKLFKETFKSNLFSLKQKTYLIFLFFILNTNIIKYKGIGMNIFKKQFNKIIGR